MPAGQVVGLIRPWGAGRSTLIHLTRRAGEIRSSFTDLQPAGDEIQDLGLCFAQVEWAECDVLGHRRTEELVVGVLEDQAGRQSKAMKGMSERDRIQGSRVNDRWER